MHKQFNWYYELVSASSEWLHTIDYYNTIIVIVGVHDIRLPCFKKQRGEHYIKVQLIALLVYIKYGADATIMDQCSSVCVGSSSKLPSICSTSNNIFICLFMIILMLDNYLETI